MTTLLSREAAARSPYPSSLAGKEKDKINRRIKLVFT